MEVVVRGRVSRQSSGNWIKNCSYFWPDANADFLQCSDERSILSTSVTNYNNSSCLVIGKQNACQKFVGDGVFGH